jgi:hypothetical protein
MIDIDNDVSIYIEDGILFLIANKVLSIDLDTAKAIVKKRLDVCNGKSYPTFLDYGKSSYADLQARQYFTKEGVEGVLLAAFCVNNVASKLFINCYLMIHTPVIPTKVFSDRSSAIKWLKQFAG